MKDEKPLTLEELAQFFQSEIKPEFEKIDARFETIDNRLNSLEEGQASLVDSVNRLEVGQAHIRAEIKELKAD